ncbi:MAG: response regulator [Candidatus Omnitrophica bacterium]|nr:response regulator [Candidatus Omnitrophota bacterium]
MDNNACVVFLDDEKSILSSLQRLFSREPFGVRTTTDFREVLTWVESGEVKVVVSDHRMPDIRGTELLEQVRELSPATVRILFTGYADFSAAQEAINHSGVHRFVSKPWDNDDLIAVVRRAIAIYDENKAKDDELKALRKRVKELEK